MMPWDCEDNVRYALNKGKPRSTVNLAAVRTGWGLEWARLCSGRRESLGEDAPEVQTSTLATPARGGRRGCTRKLGGCGSTWENLPSYLVFTPRAPTP